MTGAEENKSIQSQHICNMIRKGKTDKPPDLWFNSSSPHALSSVSYG
jgi:hypothetical protein